MSERRCDEWAPPIYLRLGPLHSQEKAKADGKFHSQLSQIERMLKEKGHDHSGAFKKPKADSEPGGFDASLTPARGKRQRI